MPGTGTLDRPEALAELARRYFRSHGPAQLQDFVWWSGLTVSDARSGLAFAASDLQQCAVGGKDYWHGAESGLDGSVRPVAHLLPNWDEYTVGYRDRAAVFPTDQPFDPASFSFGSILSNVVTVAGRVRGAWRRIVGRENVRIEIRLHDSFIRTEVSAVEKAGRRLGQFLEIPVEIEYH